MFNIRKNKKGFTLVELIVVIAILAILAGTAAGIGVTLINKNTNKSAQSEVNLLVDDFRQLILEKESDGWSYSPEAATTTAEGDNPVEELLEALDNSFQNDTKQKNKISHTTGEDESATRVLNLPTGEATTWANKKALKDAGYEAGKHTFGVSYTEEPATGTEGNDGYKPAYFTVTFSCAVKGAAQFGEPKSDVISATYTYATSIG